MKKYLVMLFVFSATAICFAQSEAGMCVSVTDVCCNTGWTSVDYNIPAGQQISTTYIHYDCPSGNQVEIQCLGFPNGEPGVVIWELVGDDAKCGCGNTSHIENIGGGQTIRFKVKCMGCDSENCALGSATVYFWTAPRAGCAPSCIPK